MINKKIKNQKGFTLIELLVVISIIGVLSSVVMVSLNSARERARDAVRMSDMSQIQKALKLYQDRHERYPSSDYQGCGGWDTPGDDDFISNLRIDDLVSQDFEDPTSNYDCGNYRYYRYGAGSGGCDASKGAYFVLGVVDMETSGRPHPQSPGWSCPSRNWQNEFDWVIGGFESEW